MKPTTATRCLLCISALEGLLLSAFDRRSTAEAMARINAHFTGYRRFRRDRF